MASNQEAMDEVANIRTLDLILKPSSFLEKIFWAILAIYGTYFIAFDVIYVQLVYWQENPALWTKENIKLSEMPLPSVTFCHKGLQKYGAVERLGNLIDAEKKVPKEVVGLRNEFLKVEFQKVKDRIKRYDYCDWLFGLKNSEEDDNPIVGPFPTHHFQTEEMKEELKNLKKQCLVIDFEILMELPCSNLHYMIAFQNFQQMIEEISLKNDVSVTQIKQNLYRMVENENWWNLEMFFRNLTSVLQESSSSNTQQVAKKGNETYHHNPASNHEKVNFSC